MQFTPAILSTLLCLATAQQQPLTLDANDLQTCSVLAFQLPGRVTFKHDSVFDSQQASYWAGNQGELVPLCRVTPRDSSDLQQTMFIISKTNVTFAVKSGGHATVANTSNVAHGLTIDLELLDHVTVKSSSRTIDVGTGARWEKVYGTLEGTGFAVAGARAGSVGVGGYLLGGGISIFAGIVGWSCDTILAMDVVLGNGTLLEVSADSHPNLFMGLKGGGSNFGIVTRFVLRLIEQRDVHVVVKYIAQNHLDYSTIASGFRGYYVVAPEDPEAYVTVSIGAQKDAILQASVMMTHTKDVHKSSALNRFLWMPGEVTLDSRMSQLAIARMIDTMNSRGYRQHRVSTTVGSDIAVLSKAMDTFAGKVHAPLIMLPAFSQAGLLIQPLTNAQLSDELHNNMLGLQREDSPLILLSAEGRLSELGSDHQAEQVLDTFTAEVNSMAKHMGKDHTYRYLNYIGCNQRAFEHQRVQSDLWEGVMKAQEEYDVESVFQKQMNHPFRLYT